jgi:hypothetical protein
MNDYTHCAEDGADIPDPSGPGVYVERTTLTAA